MAKRFGNDRRLWIEGSTPGVYSEIKGQQSLGQDGTASTIDTSDKTTAPYGTTAPGTISMSISYELYPDFPDVNGYDVLSAAFISQSAVKVQIRKDGSAGTTPADVEFEGLVYVLGRTITRNKNDVVKVNGTLGLADAPTIDGLL